jgi:hypothetical protein
LFDKTNLTFFGFSNCPAWLLLALPPSAPFTLVSDPILLNLDDKFKIVTHAAHEQGGGYLDGCRSPQYSLFFSNHGLVISLNSLTIKSRASINSK